MTTLARDRRWGGSFPGKLAAWTLLVSGLITLAYVANAAAPSPPEDLLYRYSTALAALIQYAFMLAVVLWIARGLARPALGFRRPVSWRQAGALIFACLGTTWAISALLSVFLDAGEEQGLLPEGWNSGRGGAFLANFVVIAIVAPIVEETTYRGLGFAVVGAAAGPLGAILVTALAFGLSHGLVVALPVLTVFGALLAWLRWTTSSVYPPMILHALFNAAALLAAVTFGESL